MASYVKQVFTVAELDASERCLACHAPRAGEIEERPDYAEGASTIDLDGPVPFAPLCRDCHGRQDRVRRGGTRWIWAAAPVPAAIGLATGLLRISGTPVAIVVLTACALVGVRVLYRRVRQQRGADACLLLLDAAGEDIALQIRRDAAGAAPAHGVYRAAATTRESSAREEPTTPRPARVASFRPWLLTLVTGCIAAFLAWFGAYPSIVLDNPLERPATFTIDGKARVVSSSEVVKLPYGAHRISVNGAPEQDLRVGFGQSLLVSSDVGQCYSVISQVTSLFRGVGTSVEWMATRQVVVRGPVVPIDGASDVSRSACTLRGADDGHLPVYP